MTRPHTFQRALDALTAAGVPHDESLRLLAALGQAGLSLVDVNYDELACRWVDVQVQPVPKEADTIIRTITTTTGDRTWSTTHWLEGLANPRSTQLR